MVNQLNWQTILSDFDSYEAFYTSGSLVNNYNFLQKLITVHLKPYDFVKIIVAYWPLTKKSVRDVPAV